MVILARLAPVRMLTALWVIVGISLGSIAQAQDACPEGGCAEAPLVVLNEGRVELTTPILFEIDHARVLPSSLPQIDALAALLLAHPELGVVHVEGHMSPETFELRRPMDSRLWLNRAREVRALLIARGVPAARLVASGRLTDTLVCDPVALGGRARRDCARRNDRIVLRSE